MLRIKVEVNTHETSPAAAVVQVPFAVASVWFSGQANVVTFAPAQLVATKIRALYQRKEGRDLFDLWLAITELNLTGDDTSAASAHTVPPDVTTGHRTMPGPTSDPSQSSRSRPC
jgi:predicted nucleotidyltransferase component of viral defense system